MTERDIFIAALQQPGPGERAVYLDGACGDDQALRGRVEELLREQEQLGSFLERPAEGLGGTGPFTPASGEEVPSALAENPGAVVGPYKLLQQIGEGGMGAVFMAEQTQPVQRKVALKLIRPGMDSRQVVARFEAERQAVALMDHPNIARVLDAGTTDSGRPYFVMELVKGVPLTKYCDEHKLTPKQRLELFTPVCEAVQHAHHKGVIHRDLKPSNVLVALYDGKPVPKVIDFGIAKATGARLTERTLFTEFGSVVGTLEYMSPEQAELNQLDIDTRSDVYSLGVMLYELLTGTTPLERKRLKDTGLVEMLRIIREEEPQRPSARLSTTAELPSIAASRGLEPKRLSGAIRGELDWIVMKALEKDRNRRYETANGLALDIRRHLSDEPVQACPPSAWYRFRKFARRNKRSLAVAGLILFFFAAVGGGGGWVTWDRAERRAAVERDVGRALDEARTFCLGDRLPEALSAVERAEALRAGGVSEEVRRRIARARGEVDLAARLEAIRLERASVKDGNFDFVGADSRYRDAFQTFGLDMAALDLDQAAERIQAAGIKGQLTAALDDWLLVKSEAKAAGGERLLAVLQRADGDAWRGRFRDAFRSRDRQALEDLARDQAVWAEPPATVVLLGAVLDEVGERRLVIEVLRSAQQQHPNDFWINHNLALFLMVSEPAQPGEALGYYRAALALRPNSPGVHLNLGNALDKLGKPAEAAVEYRRAVDLKQDYTLAHCYLGGTLAELGKVAAAEDELRKAVAMQPDLAQAHWRLGYFLSQYKHDYGGAVATFREAIRLGSNDALVYTNLGNALCGKGDPTGAIDAYRKAIALQPDLAEAYNGLGLALRDSGDLPGAIDAFRMAAGPVYTEAHFNLGNALLAKGDLPGAVAAFRKAIALQPSYAEAHCNLGNALYELHDPDGAIAEYQTAIALKLDLAQPHCGLGNALCDKGDPTGGIAEYRKAIALQPDCAEAHYNLGLTLSEKGDFHGAIAEYQKAIAVKPDDADAHCSLGFALGCMGDPDGAIAEYRKAITLKPDYARPHCSLGLGLQRQGEFRQALEELRRGHELGSKDPAWHYPSAQWMRECERLVELDGRLPGLLEGKIAPASAEERIELAELCSLKRLNRAAVRFFEEAFAAQPGLLDGLRYNAACAAAQAGRGRGEDAIKADDRERERLRTKALGWLRDELTRLAKLQQDGPPALLEQSLRHWQDAPDLAGVRESAQLAELPPAEQEAWRRLWAEIAEMLERGHGARPPETK